MNIENLIAQKLLQIKAIKLSPQNPFTWASGIKSPIYCDNRITLSHPEVRNIIKQAFVDLKKELPAFDHVSGVATAGIAHGALIADALGLPFSYIRSSAKKHGRQNQVEGEIAPQSKVLVVEDLISTGGSSLQAVDVIRNEGHEVVSVISIFNYGFEQAKENFKNHNCNFHSLSNYSTLLEEAVKSNYISTEDEKILRSWNKDPNAWSESHS